MGIITTNYQSTASFWKQKDSESYFKLNQCIPILFFKFKKILFICMFLYNLLIKMFVHKKVYRKVMIFYFIYL